MSSLDGGALSHRQNLFRRPRCPDVASVEILLKVILSAGLIRGCPAGQAFGLRFVS